MIRSDAPVAGPLLPTPLGSTEPRRAGHRFRPLGDRRMITRMSEHSDDEQRRLAPGITKAMRDVRNAGALTPPERRRRWNLPSDSDREQRPEHGED